MHSEWPNCVALRCRFVKTLQSIQSLAGLYELPAELAEIYSFAVSRWQSSRNWSYLIATLAQPELSERAASVADSGSTCVFCVGLFHICIGTIRVENCQTVTTSGCICYVFFPRASERRVLPIVGVCKTSSHLLIFTSAHLHIFSSSHLHIFFTPSHLLIFTSSHPHIFSSSHLLIFSSTHLHIFSSSHHHIFTSSHLHIFSSSHLLIFTSSHLRILSFSHLLMLTSSHLHIFSSCPLALLPFSISLLKARGRGSANETARNATLSHEMRFDRQKLR